MAELRAGGKSCPSIEDRERQLRPHFRHCLETIPYDFFGNFSFENALRSTNLGLLVQHLLQRAGVVSDLCFGVIAINAFRPKGAGLFCIQVDSDWRTQRHLKGDPQWTSIPAING